MKLIVAENVVAACNLLGFNSVSLGIKTGKGQTTMNRLMKARDDTPDPRLETIVLAAEALKIEPWMLFFDSIPVDLMQDKRVTESIKLLSECSPESRDKIFSQIADLAELDRFKKLNE